MKLACFVLVTIAAAAQDQTGSLTGVVVDSVSKQPVSKATVNINYTGNGGIRTGNQGPQSVITDATGAFTVNSLQPGDYIVMVQRQGYPQGGIARKKVEVKSGEKGEPLTLELTPGAIVSGRILDEDGDPMNGCFVQPHPAKNPNQGAPMQGRMNSDDDGLYRISSIPPGKYIFSVQCGQPVFQPRPLSSGPDPPPSQAYARQYYPGVADAKSAQVIELVAGSEKGGVDFQMRPAAVTQVRVTLSPAGADWRGRGPMMMQLFPADSSAEGRFGGRQNFDQERGTFDFEIVFPGSYVLTAFSGGEKPIGAFERIEVADKPVDKVIELRHAVDLNGTVEIEGNSDNKLSFSQINIQLEPVYQNGMRVSIQVKDDGTFLIPSVPPGQMRLRVSTPNAFVKSARMGTDDVTDRPIDLSSGSADPLKIVVSTNTATFRGSAPAGQIVFAERIEENPSPYFRDIRGTSVDQSGQYKLEGLAPGKFRIVLSDMGGPIPEEGGQEATIHEGETLMLDLKSQTP